ncbi:MAG: ribosomal protein S18-alanine N-acetyltransferase [Oscillospiraceae bacterium]
MIDYRQMNESDIDICAEIETYAPDPWNKAQLCEMCEGNISHSFVAEENSQPVAFCSLQAVCGEVSLNTITVLPHYRRQGIAKGLLKYAFNALCAEEVYLEVRETNIGAIALYESMGFSRVGLRQDFYQCPRENAIVMVLKSLSLT